MIKMSRKAKKAMAVALTAGMLASTAATPVMAATAGWKQNATGWWYENADGTYPANKWESIGGKWYYFDANGYMVSGWKQIPAGGKWYYFGGANDGAMKDGWFKDTTGKWSYAKPGDGAIYQDGWKQEPNGYWYYLNPNGYMQEGGWVDTAGKRYFLDKDGVMQSGVIKVDDAVYYLGDSTDGSVKTGEQVIDEVTYKFDASGAATGATLPVPTKAFKKDGTPVALDPEERELSITAVGSITKNVSGDFVLTALLSEEATTDELKDTTLTLTKGSIVVTAKFDSVSGANAIYKIENATKLTPQDSSADGKYVVTGNGIEISTECNDASYQESIVANAVQGFVYYVKDDEVHPIKDAIVEVNNKTVVTNANGYYNIYALAGKPTVKVTAAGYFGAEEPVEVSQNYLSALNVKLEEYNREALYITGTVVSDTTGSPIVEDAKVELVNAKGETIAEIKTDSNGKYAFANSAVVSVNGVTEESMFSFDEDDDDRLDKDSTYKIKITKKYNAYDEDAEDFVNLSDAYKDATYEVSMNKFGAETNLNRKTINAVKKLQGATVSMTWADDATLPEIATEAGDDVAVGDTDQTLTVNFIDQDGKTILASADDVAVVNIDGKSMKDPANLIEDVFGDEKPTLESGTYYLVVDDDTNAYCVIPVTVTEGGSIAETGTFDKAISNTLETKVDLIGTKVVELYAGNEYAGVVNAAGTGVSATDKVGVKYDVYQVVGNKEVYVYTAGTENAGVVEETPFDYDSDEKKVSINIAIEQLVTGKAYVCKPSQSHITASNVNIKSATVDAVKNLTNTVYSAADVVTLDLTEATWVKADGDDSVVAASGTKITSIKIVTAKDGKTVREVTDITTSNALSSIVAIDSDKFEGIPVYDANDKNIEYQAIIAVEGYETVTTEKFTLLDFQDAAITYNKTMTEIATTTVTGSVYDSVGNKLNEDASIIIYDASGVVVGVGKYIANNGTYRIENETNSKLGSGTYKMVVRGAGFETWEKEIQLTANKVLSQNIEVTKREGGLVKLTVRDTNNYGFASDDSDNAELITLQDKYYVDPSDDVLDKYNFLDKVLDPAGLNMNEAFIGAFGVSGTDSRGIEFESAEILSVGTYTINIEGSTLAKGNLGKDEVTIGAISANGTANIILEAVSGEKTTKLTVKFADGAGDDTEAVYWVVIEKADGTFVDKASVEGDDNEDADTVDFYVDSNATYVAKVYKNGKYVGSQEVTVQDFAKTVTVSLEDADRTK